MKKYIIMSAGKMSDVLTALKTIKTTFGRGATLSDVATLLQAQKLNKTVENQLKKGW